MLASSVALGIAGALLLGGNWKRLAAIRLAWWPLLAAAMALRLAGLAIPLGVPLYLSAILAVAIVATRNAALPGAPLIAVGSLLNAVVIAANDGMPVDPLAAVAADARPLFNDQLHVSTSSDTRLHLLSDLIPIPLFRNVYSIGDIVIAVGGFWLPFRWMRG